jgi:hypothetical protein
LSMKHAISSDEIWIPERFVAVRVADARGCSSTDWHRQQCVLYDSKQCMHAGAAANVQSAVQHCTPLCATLTSSSSGTTACPANTLLRGCLPPCLPNVFNCCQDGQQDQHSSSSSSGPHAAAAVSHLRTSSRIREQLPMPRSRGATATRRLGHGKSGGYI